MINFFKSGTTNTISVWPEQDAVYLNQPNQIFEIKLIQDYDQSTTVLEGVLINTPTPFSPRLILQVSSSDVPPYTGLYTFQLREAIRGPVTWGELDRLWKDIDVKWPDITIDKNIVLLDNDRAYVSGSDVPVFVSYTTSSTETIYQSGSIIPEPTQYITTNETGSYITYHL